MVNHLHAMQETWVWSLGEEWLPTPVILLGEFHGQRSLVGYNPWGHKELGMTEQVTLLESSKWSKCFQGAKATKKTWWMELTHLMIACVTLRMLPGASSRTPVIAASIDPVVSLNLREKQECKWLFSLLQVPVPPTFPSPGNKTILLLARRASASEMPQQPWCLASTFFSYWTGNKLIWITWPGSHFWQVPPPIIR